MIKIEINGIPAPQGSKRHVGGGRMIEMSKRVGPWRDAVRGETQRETARAQLAGHIPFPLLEAVHVTAEFRLARPASHFGSGRNHAIVRPGAPPYPGKIPDLDKLLRSTLDGLVAGGAFRDDGQVVAITAAKEYGTPGATIIVEVMS